MLYKPQITEQTRVVVVGRRVKRETKMKEPFCAADKKLSQPEVASILDTAMNKVEINF